MAPKTRIGRAVVKALAAFEAEPPEVRTRIGAAFQAAAVAIGERSIGKDTRDALIAAIVLVVAEGFMGAGWAKVHSALEEAAPALYQRWLRDLLPVPGGRNPLAL